MDAGARYNFPSCYQMFDENEAQEERWLDWWEQEKVSITTLRYHSRKD